MAGGVAVIQVGAATETELKEKKYRIEDALSATKAAVEEGIVAGGGAMLVDCSRALENVEADGDVLTGVQIVKKALEEPLKMIANNAGVEGAVIVEKVRTSEPGVGFDVISMDFVNMVEKGSLILPKSPGAHCRTQLRSQPCC